jgi:hypothetical protein
MGHYANDCTTKEDEQVISKEYVMVGAAMLTIGEEGASYDDVEEFTFHQSSKLMDPK